MVMRTLFFELKRDEIFRVLKKNCKATSSSQPYNNITWCADFFSFQSFIWSTTWKRNVLCFFQPLFSILAPSLFHSALFISKHSLCLLHLIKLATFLCFNQYMIAHTETMCQNSYMGFNQNQGKPGGIMHCCASVCFCFDLGCNYTVQTILLILVIVSVCPPPPNIRLAKPLIFYLKSAFFREC